MSGVYEVMTWLVYSIAAVTMLTMIATAILSGLALRLAAEFLRGLTGGHEGDNPQSDDEPKSPERARSSR